MISCTWAAIVALLNIFLLLWVGAIAGRARAKYQIKAPRRQGIQCPSAHFAFR